MALKQHSFLDNNHKQTESHGNSLHVKVEVLLETGFAMVGHAEGISGNDELKT
jgi:hypothetical protein